MTPSDIPAELSLGLAAHTPTLKNPVLRARIADVAWVANRKLGQCAQTAVEAYCEAVEALRSGALEQSHDESDVTDHDVIDLLRRACQIAVVTKGKINSMPERLSNLVSISRSDAFARSYQHGFYDAAELDLDYSISPALEIAREAESLVENAKPSGNGHFPLAMLELASRAYRDAGNGDSSNRLTVKAAEWCVSCADTLTHVPLLEAHWLTRAIGAYGRVRAEKARRSELRKRLVYVQAHTLDDFVPIGDSVDISDIVEKVEEQISGKSLAAALRKLILVSRSPSPTALAANVQSRLSKSPLASLFSTQILDHGGKVKATAPSPHGNDVRDRELALRHEIVRDEGIRRGHLSQSMIHPMRAIINAEHGITVEKLLPLLLESPFVPSGYEFVFAQGFARWFGGESISATSILVPQLENLLRYVLKNAGEDVSTMKSDDTQEDRSIQAIFDQMRPKIVSILGEGIAYEIENLFLFRGGPSVRHGVAHGLFSTGHFYSDDANYACWFIFHLCMLPLLSRWNDIEAHFESL